MCLTRMNRHCSCDYGWYHRYLWIGRFGLDFRRPEAGASIIYRLYSTGSRAKCRFGRSCSWVSILFSPSFGLCLHQRLNLLTLHRFAIGIVGDAGVRGTAQQPRLFVGMILILIFAEVLGMLGSCFKQLALQSLLTCFPRSLRSHCRTADEFESFSRRLMQLQIGRFGSQRWKRNRQRTRQVLPEIETLSS